MPAVVEPSCSSTSSNVRPSVGGARITVGVAGILAVIALGAAAWRTTIVSRLDPSGSLEFVVVGSSVSDMTAFAAMAVFAALLAVAAASRLGRGSGRPVPAVECLRPLLVCAFPIVGVAAAMYAKGFAGPLVYWFWEVFPWWLLLGCAAAAARAGAATRLVGRVAGAAPSWPSVRLILAAALGGWILVTSPLLRDWAMSHGDEPQYLRHAELWYLGLGEDVSTLDGAADAAARVPPRLGNSLALAARALIEDGVSLAFDLRRALSEPDFAWLRASGAGGLFVSRDGRTYQSHQPGLAVILLPGYVADRWFTPPAPGRPPGSPDQFVFVKVTLMVFAVLAGVATAALCRRAGAGTSTAAALAFLGGAALPASAMALQVYPETAAGLSIAAALVLVSSTRASTLRAGLAGLAAGYTVLLHVRFGGTAIVLLGAGMWAFRGTRRFWFVFGLAWLIPVMLQLWYVYHATGLPWPSGFYAATEGRSSIEPAAVAVNALRYAVDRNWGVLPHAPFFILGLAALVPLWRARRDLAVAVALVVGVLTATSGVHEVTGAGGTPGRFVAAVVPLLVVPVAAALPAWRQRPFPRLLVYVLAVITLDQAADYNRWHTKLTGALIAAGASGWRPNLLFADLGDGLTAPALIVPVLIGLAIVALSVTGSGPVPVSSRQWRDIRPAVAFGLCVAVLTTAAGAWRLSHPRYRMDAPAVRTALVEAYVRAQSCQLCWSSLTGPMRGEELGRNEVTDLALRAEGGPSGRVRVEVEATGPDGPPFGTVRVDFGDGHVSAPTAFAGRFAAAHRYAGPGQYRVRAWFERPGAPPLMKATSVLIRPREPSGLE